MKRRQSEGHIPDNGVEDSDFFWLLAELQETETDRRDRDRQIDRSEIIFHDCDSDMPDTIHIKWIAKLRSE